VPTIILLDIVGISFLALGSFLAFISQLKSESGIREIEIHYSSDFLSLPKILKK